ncbi:MAG: hypothetical protein V4651_12380 [Bacteroidota bacterium]
MKKQNPVRRITLVLLCTTLLLGMLNSCKNTKDLVELDSTALRDTSQSKKLFKGSGGCFCDTKVSPYCGECVSGTDGIMKGQLIKTYDVTWTNCKSNDPNWVNCKGTQTAKTKLTFCYGDPAYYPQDPNLPPSTDCFLYMQVNDPPECLRCVTTNPFCEKVKVVCDGTNPKKINVIISYGGDVSGTIEYTITVVGDPKIVFKCNAIGTDGFMHEYECTGEF